MQPIVGKKARGPKPGISRAEAYRVGLFPWKYDLQHMIAAVGLNAVIEAAKAIDNVMIVEGKKKRIRKAAVTMPVAA